MTKNSNSGWRTKLKRRSRGGFGRSILAGAVIIAVGVFFSLILKLPGSQTVAEDTDPPDVTFTRDIIPIFQENCQSCHRPGGIGPFSLMTYEETRDFAPLIKEEVSSRIMPPWLVAEGYGEFKNERRLSAEQIDTIARWVDAGAPEGNPLDMPPPRQFPEEWQLGTPDLVLDPGDDFKVRARGTDFFRSFVLPHQFEEDVYIAAIEVIPRAKEVVHHLGIYLDTEGISPKLDRESPGLGFTGDMGFSYSMIIDLWTPGGTPRFHEYGTGILVPAGSYLVMDIHYSPVGEVYYDRTSVGIYFAKWPVDKEVHLGLTGNTTFEIPAGAKNYQVTGKQIIRHDIHVLSGWPHMHYLGKEMKVWATLPDGQTIPIMWVPDYDFHWQQVYQLKEPLALPEGSYVNLIAFYDNSEDNPENPYKKPRPIRFGQRAQDEMCYFYFYYTEDDEHLLQGVTAE
jgi:hypothetical protein